MGCYVNPPVTSKEVWLLENGRRVLASECKITETEVPVCLMNNGAFTAAGVAFNRNELNAFNRPEDPRPKVWFMVSREAARAVSDLAIYERYED